jgi:hypothetical protein
VTDRAPHSAFPAKLLKDYRAMGLTIIVALVYSPRNASTEKLL